MNFRCTENWKERIDELKKTANLEQNRLDESRPASRNQSVCSRQSDVSFLKEVKNCVLIVFERPDRIRSREFQHFSVQFRERETVKNILSGTSKNCEEHSPNGKSGCDGKIRKSELLSSSAPARYMTHEENLDEQRDNAKAKKDKKIRKSNQKQSRSLAKLQSDTVTKFPLKLGQQSSGYFLI